MFSERLERLIEAALQDGVLTDQEKAAIIKRAQAEGEDIDEVDIYIQSLQQKRQQELNEQAQKAQTEEMVAQKKAREAREKEELAHEKLRKGNVCPHCGEPIPPLTKICPNCGKAVNANETDGDKELVKLVEQITTTTAKVKAASTLSTFRQEKAACESLLKKAELFYGDNKKVQMLVFDLKNEIQSAQKKLSAETRKNSFVGIVSNVWTWLILILVVLSVWTYMGQTREAKYREIAREAQTNVDLLVGKYGVNDYQFSKGRIKEFSEAELNEINDSDFVLREEIELSNKLKKVTEEDWQKFYELEKKAKKAKDELRANQDNVVWILYLYIFALICYLIFILLRNTLFGFMKK